MAKVEVTALHWDDEPLREVRFAHRKLVVRHGIGSGLSPDPHDPKVVWAIADRGPNLEIDTAVEEYGWSAPDGDRPSDAKVMPCLDLGPYLAKLRVTEEAVSLEAIVRLADQNGMPVPGVPTPDCLHVKCEPAFGFDRQPLEPNASGMDTEGIAALRDGSFWIGEEYGPSLVQVGADGRIVRRIVSQGSGPAGAGTVERRLPALAARRHLNRGFEAVAATPSEERLYIAFQSPLAHPDKEAFEHARHVRIWELDVDGSVVAQYLYPFDPPESFRQDSEDKKLGWKDLKICELAAVGERSLLVLERSTRTCKIYRVELDDNLRTPDEHLDIEHRPTAEELSARSGSFDLPVLTKTLLFDSDEHPQVTADIEGMAAVSDRELVIVSDNDFGVLDKETRFFRLSFPSPFNF